MSWLTAPLRKVAPPVTAHIAFTPDERVWQLSLDQIESETGEIVGKRYAPVSDAGTSTFSFDTGNVLYSKLRPYLNKVAIPDEAGIATTELIPLRPDTKTLNARFLAYYLRSPVFVNLASHHVAGAKMPRVVMDWFWEHEAPIPASKEQIRIVELLDEADRLRRLRRVADAKAARILPVLFLNMFGDPATNPNAWPVKKLGLIADTSSGGTPDTKRDEYYGGHIPWVKSGELACRTISKTEETISEAGLLNSSAKWVEPGTILVAMYGATVGQVAKLAIRAATNQAVCAVKAMGEVQPGYLIELLRLSKPIFLVRRVGGAQPNISQQIVRDLEVPIPPCDLQVTFSNMAIEVEKAIEVASRASEQLESLFRTLMQRAFSGQLTNKWREAHLKELLAEMEVQARLLNLPMRNSLEVAQ
jgi:type I restriction enzyme S subunit